MSVDRTNWPPGPWDDEPDIAEWTDDATGRPCLAVRQPKTGHWCGYVRLPESSPDYGRDEPQLNASLNEGEEPNVHWGITWSDAYDHVFTTSPIDWKRSGR